MICPRMALEAERWQCRQLPPYSPGTGLSPPQGSTLWLQCDGLWNCTSLEHAGSHVSLRGFVSRVWIPSGPLVLYRPLVCGAI